MKKILISFLLIIFTASMLMAYEIAKVSGAKDIDLEAEELTEVDVTLLGVTLGRGDYKPLGKRLILTAGSSAILTGSVTGRDMDITSEDLRRDPELKRELAINFTLKLQLFKPGSRALGDIPFRVLERKSRVSQTIRETVEYNAYDEVAKKVIRKSYIKKSGYEGTESIKKTGIGHLTQLIDGMSIPSTLKQYSDNLFYEDIVFDCNGKWYEYSSKNERVERSRGKTFSTTFYYRLNSVKYTNGKKIVLDGTNVSSELVAAVVSSSSEDGKNQEEQIDGDVVVREDEEALTKEEEATWTTLVGSLAAGIAAAFATAATSGLGSTLAGGATASATSTGAASSGSTPFGSSSSKVPQSSNPATIKKREEDEAKEGNDEKNDRADEESVKFTDSQKEKNDELVDTTGLSIFQDTYGELLAPWLNNQLDEILKQTDDQMGKWLDTAFDNVSKGYWKPKTIDNYMKKMEKTFTGLARGKVVINGIKGLLTLVETGVDAYNNTRDVKAPDGTVIKGDTLYHGTKKAVVGVMANMAVTEACPQLAALDLANSIAFGNTQAGDILSPSANIKGVTNLLCDLGSDEMVVFSGQSSMNGVNISEVSMVEIQTRMKNGMYGENLKNFYEASEIVIESSSSVQNMKKAYFELGEVLSDDNFYDGMDNTIEKLFEDKTSGKMGSIARFASSNIRGGLHMVVESGRTVNNAVYKSCELVSNAYDATSSFFGWS